MTVLISMPDVSTARRADPLRPLAHPVSLVIASVVALCAVVGFGLFVAGSSGWSTSELGVDQWLSLRHSPVLDGIALTIAWLFDPAMAGVIVLVSAAVVGIVTRNPGRVLTLLGMIAVAWGGSEVLKRIVHLPRPDATLLAHPLLTEHSFSYPSGHTCFVVALGAAVIFLVRDHRYRPVITAVAILATVLVAVSRVYLGVHYPTDVAASIVYSVAASILALVVWLRYVLPHFPAALRERPSRQV
ncbi:phosphatase PAP2 family protein [Glaciibacter psychrotolerans]|uniref:Undecaprenyl-diphosphatase n=1 Tax=Glaciibacter psychrotolerans TaxID=670054 RepID=A0A7Z0ED95_9MICO|nr:phosphatase PAP2 family protein [Leifsonia psychrotolerans]NYJ19512.1 undecaprenyl-diphosphatase [Leifsonia psychrotolerans]